MSKISWNHHFSWTLSGLTWSPVQQSTINCSGVKIQNTRFDESDGPVAKIVKGWKMMFLCWCQQKFAVRGGRQRSRGRCTCQWSHSETEKKKNKCHCLGKLVTLQQKRLDFLSLFSLSLKHTDLSGKDFFLFYQNLRYIFILTFHLQCHCATFPWNIILVIGCVFKGMCENSFYSDTKPGNRAANETSKENR